MEGFQRALQEWERDNIYFPLDKFNNEESDKSIDYYDEENPAGYPNGDD
jgi:hypothetical protein